MFKVTMEMIKEYHDKSLFISETIRSLGRDNLLENSGLDKKNVQRIMETNHNNFEALNHSLNTGEVLGRMMFWFIKKTVDMNFNSVKSIKSAKTYKSQRNNI